MEQRWHLAILEAFLFRGIHGLTMVRRALRCKPVRRNIVHSVMISMSLNQTSQSWPA